MARVLTRTLGTHPPSPRPYPPRPSVESTPHHRRPKEPQRGPFAKELKGWPSAQTPGEPVYFALTSYVELSR